MAEENTDPARTLPRAIIGGALLVAALYLLISIAFLRVLPMGALAITCVFVVVIILTGSFEQIVALFAVLFLVYYIAAFLAVFVVRYRFPTLPRPYKALGYPFSTGIVLVGSIAFLIAAVAEDSRSAASAG